MNALFSNCLKSGLAFVAIACLVVMQSVQAYDFATYSWDQANTPDVGSKLTAGTYSGAIVTDEPTDDTSVVNFPNPPTTGFNTALSLGSMIIGGAGTRALNLPDGNNGESARSGIELSWTANQGLPNLTGDDFVVYESASSGSSPEGFMVQVRNALTSTFSSWRYEQPDTFALYNPAQGAQGAFAHAFDLSDFGLSSSDLIDTIRIVNLTDEDRMVSATGVGEVIPEDNGNTSSNLPDPGSFASFSDFGASTLDPDPLYVASLHDVTVIPEPGTIALCGIGLVLIGVQRNRLSRQA